MSDGPVDNALFPERFVPGEMHGLIEAEHLARYRWVSACATDCSVLDAGCGLGYGSLLLRAAGASSVTGVDIAEQTVDAARQQGGDGVQFVVGDISALELPDAAFELAVCFEAIEHVHEQSRALDELRRVLTPDGLLAISSPNRDVYQEGNPHHTHEYTPDELRSALLERFANVRLERQQAWTASMISSDETLRHDDPARAIDVEVRKVAGADPGRELFTVALASDAPLPHPRPLAIVTDLGELTAWRERARSAEDHLERARQAAGEAYDSYRSANDAYKTADAAYKSASAAYTSSQKAYENTLVALEHSEHERERSAHEQERSEHARERSEYERERTQQSLDRVSTLLAERNATLRLTAAQLTTLRERNAELETALQTSATALAELRTSPSWRLTAPLRALRRGRSGV